MSNRSLFLPLMGLLFLFAWLSLWLWDMSPYGRYLHHSQGTFIDVAGTMHLPQVERDMLVTTLFYVFGWVLMTTAMMLPTTLPLLEAYRRLTLRCSNQWFLMLLVVSGYLGVWLLFGIAAHGLDHGLHALLRQQGWFVSNGWAFGAGVFCIAGLFQFSSIKHRCLEKCRSPLGFVLRHWGRTDKRRQAWLLGLDHGIYCVGCCWALMLLMFVLASGNIGWMLLLGAVMAAEKNTPVGNRLSIPLGSALIIGAAAMVIANIEIEPNNLFHYLM